MLQCAARTIKKHDMPSTTHSYLWESASCHGKVDVSSKGEAVASPTNDQEGVASCQVVAAVSVEEHWLLRSTQLE